MLIDIQFHLAGSLTNELASGSALIRRQVDIGSLTKLVFVSA